MSKVPAFGILTKFFFAVSLSVSAFFCAGQVAPSGGPPDTTPPKIVYSFPDSGTVNFQDVRIAFSFDKYVDRRSLEESFFTSPSLGELTFDWSGKDVEIRFADSLRKNTTYIATIGTDLVDTRGNHLAQAFALPFSTGSHIDSGSASGSVVDPKPSGVMIFAYLLNSRNPDTLNPTHTKPDYLTQTGKDGTFVLPYLALGRYRLIAERDEFKDLLYDVQTDQYGTLSSDITLTPEDPSRKRLQFQLTSQDTTLPFLSSARSLDRRHVLLRFSESMSWMSADTGSVSIVDTTTNKPLEVIDLSFIEPQFNTAQVVTAEQESTHTYRVQTKGFKDIHGNLMSDSANTGDFTTNQRPDTVKPIANVIAPHSHAMDFPVDDTIQITFSEAVLKPSFESGFALTDSSGLAVNGIFLWKNSMAVSFLPKPPLKYEMEYKLRIALDSVVDFSGNHSDDSTVVTPFQTVDERALSSIEGTVFDDSTHARGKIFITAMNISNKTVKSKTVVVDTPSVFMFSGLFEGEYTLSAFRDADSNGMYSYGTPFPFVSAERFTIYPDTLKLRARWPLEGVRLHFH